VATVVQQKSGKVIGVVWEITAKCEKILDKWEGVAYGTYRRHHLKVLPLGSGVPFDTLVYIAADETRGHTMSGYSEKVIQGAREHGIPDQYIDELVRACGGLVNDRGDSFVEHA
jgi:gamma-glutamylcyclotransferase (GGCT)/AIG2-like uncharacterized protein YtfP